MKTLRKTLILTILLLITVPAPVFSSPATNDIVIEEIAAKGQEKGTVKMTFTVDASPEELWNLLVKYDKWPQFMPDLDKVVIRESNEKSAIVYVKAKAPLNLDISYVLKRNYNRKDYKITWIMLEGRAKEIKGSWQIVPVSKNKCKAIYTNSVDFGYIVPQKVVNILTKQKLPDLANGIKSYFKK